MASSTWALGGPWFVVGVLLIFLGSMVILVAGDFLPPSSDQAELIIIGVSLALVGILIGEVKFSKWAIRRQERKEGNGVHDAKLTLPDRFFVAAFSGVTSVAVVASVVGALNSKDPLSNRVFFIVMAVVLLLLTLLVYHYRDRLHAPLRAPWHQTG